MQTHNSQLNPALIFKGGTRGLGPVLNIRIKIIKLKNRLEMFNKNLALKRIEHDCRDLLSVFLNASGCSHDVSDVQTSGVIGHHGSVEFIQS